MKSSFLFFCGILMGSVVTNAQLPVSLMHEMRETPSPADKSSVNSRFVSLQWPLAENCHYVSAPKTRNYKVRYATDRGMKKSVVEKSCDWPFLNITSRVESDSVFWQHAYVANGKEYWSEVLSFAVSEPERFCPPGYDDFISMLPASHPRVYASADSLDLIRAKSPNNADAKFIVNRANKALKEKFKTPDDIKSSMADNIANESQRNQMIVRESRRVIDRTENSVDVLIKAYVITGDDKYSDEAIRRVMAMTEWTDNPKIAGDFNAATFMNVFALTYDLLNDKLSEDQKKTLMQRIGEAGANMYSHFNNHLENHIADNHVWQMTLRIFTFGAFTAYGHIPEADKWCEYAYNVWLARFPGLNADGAWHNGDSYCHVNIRTLIEVPYFYSRISGYNFFNDPWYEGNVMYTIYNQPPGSHSGGNGSGHLEKNEPLGVRVGYADALAKMTGNPYAADYVRICTSRQANIMQKGCTDKGGGLAWWRLQCSRELPDGRGLADLPMAHIFPQSGLASFSNKLASPKNNAMLSFRSSPYGSTSHALANQNAFCTFFGGEPLFYSTGHHTSFVDRHALLCERSTRAHNTILVDGIGQRIGAEGYGWMPRHYVGTNLAYTLGDASAAYGPVISKIWQKRAKDNEIDLTPENGWDEVDLKTFRRHVVKLGNSGLAFIYDELEAETPRRWSYLLHTVTNPMDLDLETGDCMRISAIGNKGVSDAFVFTDTEMQCDTTSNFFTPADNWLKADADGNFAKYPNHYHFTATSTPTQKCRIATVINTHHHPKEGASAPAPKVRKDGSIKMGEWIIYANLSSDGAPSFSIKSSKEETDASISYDGGATEIRENGIVRTLEDEVPELEI